MLGELELAGVEIEPAERIGEDIGGHDPDLDAVAAAQPLDDGGIEIGGGQAEFVGEAFGGGVEGGEVIAMGLEEGEHIGEGAGGGAGDGGGGFMGEAEDGLGDGGLADGEIAQLGAGDIDADEARICEDTHKLVGEAAGFAFCQTLEIEIIGAGELEEEGGGERALITLDEIEIGDGDAEIGGHAGLGEAEGGTERADAGAGEELAGERLRALQGGRLCQDFYRLTEFIAKIPTILHEILTDSR